MTNLASALAFVGFAALAVLLALAPAASRRRVANALVLYVMAVSAAAAIGSRDFWPFSSWHMMQTVAPTAIGTPRYRLSRLVGVVAGGAEYRVDARAWEPLDEDELTAWLKFDFPNLPPDAQDRIGAYLLARANVARAAVREGRAPGSGALLTGPLAAPTHLVHAKLWTRPDAVPEAPFVQLRLYDELWDLEARFRDPHAVRLALLYQYPRVP